MTTIFGLGIGITKPTISDIRVGQVYGRWQVLSDIYRDKDSVAFVDCVCVCGSTKKVIVKSLIHGRSKSCGCLHNELLTDRNTTHGKCGSTEYSAWQNMKHRCYDESNDFYRDYGARGIKVCDEWLHDFKSFYDYVGDKPSPKHSIDRIDNDGNYEPGNVRWTTSDIQGQNTRLKRNNKTGYRGICLRNDNHRYRAYITHHNKRISLGTFDDIKDAINARKVAEDNLWGGTVL